MYPSWGLQNFQIKISKYFSFKTKVNKYHYFNLTNTRVYTYILVYVWNWYSLLLKYKFIWRKDQNIWLYNSLLKLRMVIWSYNNHSVESCSVLNLNYPLWHETCKLSNNNGLNFSNVKHDQNTFICMTTDTAFTYTSHCAWCYFISYVIGSIVSFYIVLHICTHTCWIKFLDGIPELVHEHIWSCSFSIKLCLFECWATEQVI